MCLIAKLTKIFNSTPGWNKAGAALLSCFIRTWPYIFQYTLRKRTRNLSESAFSLQLFSIKDYQENEIRYSLPIFISTFSNLSSKSSIEL